MGYTIFFIKAWLFETLIIKDLTYFNTSRSDKKTTKNITKDNLPLN